MTSALTVVERFGDAHVRFRTDAGGIVDVVREGSGWRAYAMNDACTSGSELFFGASETEVLSRLQGLTR